MPQERRPELLRWQAALQEQRQQAQQQQQVPSTLNQAHAEASSGLLGAAVAGFQLLLGPGTSGVVVNFFFSVLDARAS